MDNILDLTYATDGYRGYGGSDSKKSVFFEGDYYMVKFSEEKIKRTSIETSESNSIFSEYIGSHISQSMGLPTHETKLAIIGDEPAVACKDFKPKGKNILEFDWFMKNVYRKSEIGRIPSHNQIYETIDNTRLSLIKDEAIKRYWDTFILDSLIGNFDRHKGNWGYLADEVTGTIELAPIYDCGSSLYPSLSEKAFDKILSNQEEIMMRMHAFPKAALNKNSDVHKIDKYGYLELIGSGIDKNCTDALIRMYPKIDMNRISDIIDNTPMISENRKHFYKEMISYRKELILDKAIEQCIDNEKKNIGLFTPLHEKETVLKRIESLNQLSQKTKEPSKNIIQSR